MLAIRYLNGPHAGQIYLLKEGAHRFGRSLNCQVQIPSQGISKEHFEIQNQQGSLVLLDLQSSNGTFLNGKKIKKGILKNGDRIGVDKVLFEIVKISENRGLATSAGSSPLMSHGGMELHGNHSPVAGHESPSVAVSSESIKEKIENYLERVLLPAIYQLAVVFEFKAVILGFAGLFIFMVTLLSSIPMNQITEESIQIESLRRAQTVARALASSNERAIRSGEMSSYSADLVLKDEGIANVYVLGRDGAVMAPPEMSGYVVKDLVGFVQAIKGHTKEFAAPIQGGKLAASTPILVYDPEIQQNIAKAYAVVVYNPGYLRFDDGRALSLFIQVLIIAILLGGLIFFFMYKLIERPFKLLNSELDLALREGRDHANISFKFPALQQTLVTINSLLNRISHTGSQGHGHGSGAHLSETEWMNLVQLVGYPALLVSKDSHLVSLNHGFEQLTGIQGHQVQGQSLQFIPDQALQKNIQALIEASHSSPQAIHQDRLELGGQFYTLNCQAISASEEIMYYVVTLTQAQEMGGSIAGGAA